MVLKIIKFRLHINGLVSDSQKILVQKGKKLQNDLKHETHDSVFFIESGCCGTDLCAHHLFMPGFSTNSVLFLSCLECFRDDF